MKKNKSVELQPKNESIKLNQTSDIIFFPRFHQETSWVQNEEVEERERKKANREKISIDDDISYITEEWRRRGRQRRRRKKKSIYETDYIIENARDWLRKRYTLR